MERFALIEQENGIPGCQSGRKHFSLQCCTASLAHVPKRQLTPHCWVSISPTLPDSQTCLTWKQATLGLGSKDVQNWEPVLFNWCGCAKSYLGFGFITNFDMCLRCPRNHVLECLGRAGLSLETQWGALHVPFTSPSLPCNTSCIAEDLTVLTEWL